MPRHAQENNGAEFKFSLTKEEDKFDPGQKPFREEEVALAAEAYAIVSEDTSSPEDFAKAVLPTNVVNDSGIIWGPLVKVQTKRLNNSKHSVKQGDHYPRGAYAESIKIALEHLQQILAPYGYETMTYGKVDYVVKLRKAAFKNQHALAFVTGIRQFYPDPSTPIQTANQAIVGAEPATRMECLYCRRCICNGAQATLDSFCAQLVGEFKVVWDYNKVHRMEDDINVTYCRGGVELVKLYMHDADCNVPYPTRQTTIDREIHSPRINTQLFPQDIIIRDAYEFILEKMSLFQQPLTTPAPGEKIDNGIKDYPYDNRRFLFLPTMPGEGYIENDDDVDGKSFAHLEVLRRCAIWFINHHNLSSQFTREFGCTTKHYPWPKQNADPHIFFNNATIVFGGHAKNQEGFKEPLHQFSHTDMDDFPWEEDDLRGLHLPSTHAVFLGGDNSCRQIYDSTPEKPFNIHTLKRGYIATWPGHLEHGGMVYDQDPSKGVDYRPALHFFSYSTKIPVTEHVITLYTGSGSYMRGEQLSLMRFENLMSQQNQAIDTLTALVNAGNAEATDFIERIIRWGMAAKAAVNDYVAADDEVLAEIPQEIPAEIAIETMQNVSQECAPTEGRQTRSSKRNETRTNVRVLPRKKSRKQPMRLKKAP